MKMNGSANGGHDEEVGVGWWVVVTKYILLDDMLSPSVLTCPGFVVHFGPTSTHLPACLARLEL